jgi:hypothetical protein
VAYTVIGFIIAIPLIFLLKNTKGTKLPEKILASAKR